jgi:hypothetical protein
MFNPIFKTLFEKVSKLEFSDKPEINPASEPGNTELVIYLSCNNKKLEDFKLELVSIEEIIIEEIKSRLTNSKNNRLDTHLLSTDIEKMRNYLMSGYQNKSLITLTKDFQNNPNFDAIESSFDKITYKYSQQDYIKSIEEICDLIIKQVTEIDSIINYNSKKLIWKADPDEVLFLLNMLFENGWIRLPTKLNGSLHKELAVDIFVKIFEFEKNPTITAKRLVNLFGHDKQFNLDTELKKTTLPKIV